MNFDNYGFYIETGYGNRYHSHHFPLNLSPGVSAKDDLQIEENELINEMTDGQAPNEQIPNVLFNITGKFVPRSTIWHITKFQRRLVVNDSYFDDMNDRKPKTEIPQNIWWGIVDPKFSIFNYY